MPTTFSTTLQPSNSTDLLFRAWCTFLRAGFDTAGWVQVFSTDLTTVTHPTLTSNFPAKIVYRMDDSLAGTSPVYVMVEMGSTAGAANNPCLNLTIGTGYNAGTGLITGQVFTNVSAPTRTQSNSSSTSLNPSYSLTSGSPSRIAITLFAGSANGSPGFAFGIERAKDSSGADVAGGIYLLRTITSGLSLSSYIDMSTGLAGGSAEGRVSTAFPMDSQSLTTQSDVGVGLIVPWQSITQPAPPATNFLYVTPADWTTDLQLTVYLYGRPVVFRRLHSLNGLQGSYATVTTKCCMRWD